MRIVKLAVENVKRIRALSITPNGTLTTVGGKNGAGKSSVLDSIAYAMGGEKLVPSEPIRSGESEGKIVVDLGDLVVTRKFTRKYLECDCGADMVPGRADLEAHSDNCAKKRFGETTSSLTVTNKDGAKYPSPQAVLDRLLGKLTFDPLEFARADTKAQDTVLRSMVGLDVTPIEARRKEAFDKRAMLKKTYAIKEAQLVAMPFHKEAPNAEIPIAEVSNEMLRAEELRKIAEDAERAVLKASDAVSSYAIVVGVNRERIESLERQLAEVRGLEAKNEGLRIAAECDLDARQNTATEARAAVPDAAAIRTKLDDVTATNVKVRANQNYMKAQTEVETLERDIDVQHNAVLTAENDKQQALLKAQFPVEGLGLSDDGVTYNGLPFAQASSSEQVEVSVAIGIALNTQLKVLLIRNGNMLDKDSLAAVTAQAEAAEMQVWMEYVSETGDGVAVMLVDGEVV